MRMWSSRTGIGTDRVCRIVIPQEYRKHVLTLAHDDKLSGHLGIRKTYDRVLRHFFWPNLKSDVVWFCASCHTCQIVGKPNQPVPPAPLHPIPVMSEPFDEVIVDCVGPLPRTKTGNQFMLTMMCRATRYPEAIPLCNITSKTVIASLIRELTSCPSCFRGC